MRSTDGVGSKAVIIELSFGDWMLYMATAGFRMKLQVKPKRRGNSSIADVDRPIRQVCLVGRHDPLPSVPFVACSPGARAPSRLISTTGCSGLSVGSDPCPGA